MARFFHGKPLPALELVSPPGVLDHLARLEDAGGVRELHASFASREVEPGGTFETGPFRFETRLLPHLAPNMWMKITAGGATLAYTGDTGPSEEVEALAQGTDVLVVEASWVDGQEEGKPPIHLTARQAAEHALRADVPHLVLSHFWPTNDRELSRAQATEGFEDGKLTIAEEHLRLKVGG